MDKPKVLLVEDEPLILEVIKESLEDGGFAVTAVATGEEAVAALESGSPFHGLVTDVFLTGPVTGWELAKIARGAFPTIAVVYETGHGEADWPVEGVPGSVLISKPFAPAQVVAALSSHLNTDG